jgi:uncharacterized protein YjdB
MSLRTKKVAWASVVAAFGAAVILPACASPTTPTTPTLSSLVLRLSTTSLIVTQTLQVLAIANMPDGSTQDVTARSTWSSSSSSVASVTSAGLVTAQQPGTTTITAAYQNWTSSGPINVSLAK